MITQLHSTVRQATALLAGSIAALALVGLASADSIFVPNSSFELGGTPSGQGVTSIVDNWTRTPDLGYAGSFGIGWEDTAGAFYGVAFVYDNPSGDRGAYALGFPGTGFYQDNEVSASFVGQFEVGKSYDLTVGAYGKNLQVGANLEISFYYRDASHNMVAIPDAATVIPFSSATFPATTESGLLHMPDFTAHLPTVTAGDAWAGKFIGIQFKTLMGFESITQTGPSYWDVDNVRVTSAVPEPASLGLLALGAAGLFGRRARPARRA